MELLIEHIAIHTPNQVKVQWSFIEPDLSLLSGVRFSIYRSGSPEGPWDLIGQDLDSVFFTDNFQDSDGDFKEENLLSLNRQVWYRVEAYLSNGSVISSLPKDNFGTLPTLFDNVPAVGLVPDPKRNFPEPATIFHPSKSLHKRLQLVQRAFQRKALFNLQYFSGTHVAVLKKKTFGTRCTVCFDQATKTVTLSRCKSCYSTGWEGGYFDPIRSNARIIEASPQVSLEPSGKAEIIQSNIELLDYPRLVKDDIIVELDSNRRWIVKHTSTSTLRRRSLTQQVSCTELSRTASVYDFPLDNLIGS